MQRRSLTRSAVAAAAVAALLAVAGCSSNPSPAASTSAAGDFNKELHDMLPDYIKQSGVVTAGALFQTPPIIGASDSDPNVPVGTAPDLAKLVGDILGVKFEFKNMQWPAQLPGVQSGAVDALWGQVTITAEREQSIVDLVPFDKVGNGLLVAAGNPKNITSIASQCGLTAGVPIGSQQSSITKSISDKECVANGKPAIKLAQYQDASSAIQALRAGTTDSWLNDVGAQQEVAKATPNTFKVVPVSDAEFPSQYTGIAVSKQNPGLTNALVEALRILIKNGQYADVMKKWDRSYASVTADEVVANPITKTPVGQKAAS